MQIITNVTLSAAGEQPANISSHDGPDTGHVQVQVHGCWVTALDLDAVISHAYAWSTARAEAVGYLPQKVHVEPLQLPTAATVIVRHVGYTQPQVYLSADDRPHLEVIVGSLRVRAYDLLAVETYSQAWDRAVAIARTIWRGTPPRIDPDAVTKVLAQRGQPAIARDGLPPNP
ncbi:hypothetical protein CLV47_12329 [Antricoccus suffuscus]|uniref:Uncharacterized protein n=1 Tax=Antricoccus suffuscus TaxID=1629062 RepID=A0A2T0ZEN9_9ACTN|nr:hypothetical protein [Antricoccus suffuscus]PRZ34797.1 hypothetical protein CLV47_12329 [Antricoccus suffuscus]